MTSPATMTRLILLLIAQQALSRPSDSEDNDSETQTDNRILSVYAGNLSEDLATREMGQPIATITSGITNAETEEPVSQAYPVTNQGSLEATTKGQNNPTAKQISSVISHSSQSEPPGSYETRGFWSNLFGSFGATGSQNPNKPRVGQQSATIVSATTYPEGSKPATPSKPATGQEKPTGTTTGQDSSTATQTPSFGPFPDSSATFPGYMGGFMKPPQAGYMAGFKPPPPPPMMFGSHFGGLGSPFGSDASLMSQTGPTTFLQGVGSGFALPAWIVSLMRSSETSPPELSFS